MDLWREAKGFTLLEVLIGAVLIIVGVGSIGLTVISVRRFFKGEEDRSRAMRLASAKIEECLAKGYSGAESLSPLPEDPDKNDGFDWILRVSTETASGEKSGTIYRIPFKKAEVVVSYTADRGSGGIKSIRNIRLTNILPYPIMHATSVRLGSGAPADAQVPWVEDDKSEPFTIESDSTIIEEKGSASIVGPEDLDADGDGKYLKLENLQWNMDQDIQVIYSIALNVEDIDGEMRSVDTAYTACLFDGVQTGLISRTPLRSQTSFSNNLELEDVEKDTPHTIEVRWYYSNAYIDEKDKDGDGNEDEEIDEPYDSDDGIDDTNISLREAILTVLPAEPPEN